MQEKKSFSRVLGTGGYLPGKPVTNQDLVNRLCELDVETSDEWIKERSGITSRHFCGKMSTRDMGCIAAKKAIEAASIDVTSIDLIIVATTTPDLIFPSVACHIEKDLGLDRCTSFDIQAVCSGFVYALTVADLFLKTGTKNNALVIGAERLSTILNWRDRSTCVLFGDGAGAVILGKSNVPGIIAGDISSSGKFCDILRATGTPKNGVLEGTGYAEMQGQEVF
ncbi:MAG: 3-oxoacyl-ACP synthase, partial [Proteobacteria bacterium]|nr:3-oxoacyl-ACP synthase [Pseudomonadota bacterium]